MEQQNNGYESRGDRRGYAAAMSSSTTPVETDDWAALFAGLAA